jgi:hypothetical protein
MNFAASVAGDNLGFGTTRPVAPFFATNCALAGFASDEETPFPHSRPPCLEIRQKDAPDKRAVNHQCVLSSVCGYQYAERTLGEVNLWAGHVLSMDRSVSPLYSDFNLRHFEFIARCFDLLVVDECDGAQSTLDARGTPVLKISGDENSLWDTLIRDLHQPAARGRNAFIAGEAVPTLFEMTARFGRETERLVGRITHFSNKFRNDNANSLLTSLSIIADVFADRNDPDPKRHNQIRQGFERIWDAATKRVAFRHQVVLEEDEEAEVLERTVVEAAHLMEVGEDEVRSFYDDLLQAIELWDRDGNDNAVQHLAQVLRHVPNLVSPHDDERFFEYCGMLVSVSMVVLQHFGLAPHLRLMNSEGLVSDNVFDSRPSRDLLAAISESLIGRLSGVRYAVSDEGNVDVTHVGFVGTPRCLPQRMRGIGGSGERPGEEAMAVLLTSATSMLEQSPNFHIDDGPDYVLCRPNAGSGWKDSRYSFFPQTNPRNGRELLRFSGARLSQREEILRAMVDQLLVHGAFGKVASAIANNDVVDGVGRKAAFVVNSYDQTQMIYQHIKHNHPDWQGRVRYLARFNPRRSLSEHALTAAKIESLGKDKGWDLLIFPMSAIGRGVNIVYHFGSRLHKAMIGSLYFLTRPHPRGDSLQLIQGLVGRASERFDKRQFSDLATALAELKAARQETSRMAEHLLRMPLVAQSLGEFAEPFVADQMIIILQTIGRAMRGDCPAYVYFVDAAWAPNSAYGEKDTRTTSMLVMMQSILHHCLNHPDPDKRECYQNLYQSFAEPLNKIDNLIS